MIQELRTPASKGPEKSGVRALERNGCICRMDGELSALDSKLLAAEKCTTSMFSEFENLSDFVAKFV